jgi:predicted transcriptional regulator
MSTTSLKLPDSLKQRAAAAARARGVSPHAFMVDAIEQAATLAEQRDRFLEEAQAARVETLASGEGYDADEVHAYLAARIEGKQLARPKARSWRR